MSTREGTLRTKRASLCSKPGHQSCSRDLIHGRDFGCNVIMVERAPELVLTSYSVGSNMHFQKTTFSLLELTMEGLAL
jgi:hypothetical protein